MAESDREAQSMTVDPVAEQLAAEEEELAESAAPYPFPGEPER